MTLVIKQKVKLSPKIQIKTKSIYIKSQSSPEENKYMFAYTVKIKNLGHTSIQLWGRYWLITNGHFRKTEVQGEGVIGEKPYILPGKEFRYVSGAVIETPLGTMEGYYLMVDNLLGRTFFKSIPPFLLAVPRDIH